MTASPARTTRLRPALAVALTAVVGVLAAPPADAAGTVPSRAPAAAEAISVTPSGHVGNGRSDFAAISPDGRWAAFVSTASDLVRGDTNGTSDVFLRDLVLGRTERVSLGTGGVQGNASSSAASVSADGRYIAFSSFASNLVPGDTNGAKDVFVRDRVAGTTTRVSVALDGAQAAGVSSEASISADGRYVSFRSTALLTPGATSYGIYLRDRVAGTLRLVSLTDRNTAATRPQDSQLSGSGRYVLFVTRDPRVVADDTNGTDDLFLRDVVARTTERISVSTAGRGGNGESGLGSSDTPADAAITPDGRFVAFRSSATDLVPGDTNGSWDVFLRDRRLGVTTRVSRSDSGAQARGTSYAPAMSADGNRVAFVSSARNLTEGSTGGVPLEYAVFERDRAAGTTTRVSARLPGTPASGNDHAPAMAADGRPVVYSSDASTLVPGDDNGVRDVFVQR